MALFGVDGEVFVAKIEYNAERGEICKIASRCARSCCLPSLASIVAETFFTGGRRSQRHCSPPRSYPDVGSDARTRVLFGIYFEWRKRTGKITRRVKFTWPRACPIPRSRDIHLCLYLRVKCSIATSHSPPLENLAMTFFELQAGHGSLMEVGTDHEDAFGLFYR